MNLKLSCTVAPEDNLKTIKFILKNRLGLSERLVKKLKYAQQILCNSIPVHINAIVSKGDLIEALVEFNDVNEDIIPEDIPLDILYEDDCLIIINKPSDTVVHPTFRHFTGTVANAVMFYLLQKGIKTRIRPVSRLDRDTTGIIVFALNQYVQENLIRQMGGKTYYKEYVGIVHGIIEGRTGTINLPIERKPDSIMLRHIDASGSPSVTHYEVIEQLQSATFLKFILETGRTHQIRVHCQATGHPLLGDTLYPYLEDVEINTEIPQLMTRQALHSYKCSFMHPVTGVKLDLTAPIPSDIKNALEILKKPPLL